MFDHGASKDKYIFFPDQYDDSISNLKCFSSYSQVVVKNIHIEVLHLLAEKYKVLHSVF